MATPTVPPIDLPSRDEGKGPPIVLLHGVGARHLVWNEVIPPLAAHHRVVAPDLRGHGRAPAPPDSTYSFDEHAADVLQLLDTKGFGEVHLVGSSAGALLALRLALDHPERTRSLVMVSGASYCDNHTRAIAERWIDTYGKEGADAFALRVLKDCYYPDWMEAHMEFADEVRAEVPKMEMGPAVRWSRAMMAFDERKRIGSVGRPTLIVQAMDDEVVDASHGRILRQSIPGAQIRIFAQTGHMISIERPTELAEAIGNFVDDVETRSGGPRP